MRRRRDTGHGGIVPANVYKMKALDARKRVIKTWKETKSIRKTARWMG